jgi:3-hydroxyacyl-CoA dehydrogenase
VTLLDRTRELADAGLERAKLARPPQFYLSDRFHDVRTGSLDDDLALVSEADWVCEAIFEDLDAKRALFERVGPHLRPDAMLSTNTSGLPIKEIALSVPPSFQSRFVGTHFFNPPRYLKLLELITTPQTDPLAAAAMTRFLEENVARRVVPAKDTPGFIANRFGMASMFHAIHTAEKLHFSIEQVDAITGSFLGRPKSASFRLNDLVGLDVMAAIGKNLVERCPNDPFMVYLQQPASMIQLLQRGWIGEKVKQGYYRREGKELLAIDLKTFAYRDREDIVFPQLETLMDRPLGERVRQALERRDEPGEFLREHLVPALQYANTIREEISHSVLHVDRVMQWGFGWELGPFQLIDAIGPSSLSLQAPRFYQIHEVLSHAGGFVPMPSEPEFRIISDFPVIETHENFEVRDLGDEVFAFVHTTKAGAITPSFVTELHDWLANQPDRPLIWAGKGKSFSVGFDLRFVLERIEGQDWAAIEAALAQLCDLGELMETRKIVAAIHGYCLGAGLELALSCSNIALHPEAMIGLPEAKVGLLPAGRGTALVRLNNQHSAKRLAEVAMVVSEGQVSQSADHARLLGYLRPSDVTIYHPDRLIFDAKQLALQAHPVARPIWTQPEGPISGMINRLQDEAKRRGEMSDHDELIGDKIRAVFAKSPSYEDALAKERTGFLDLCAKALSQARIRHMLESGKPLRN